MRSRVLAPPFVIRLLAVVLAVAGASGVAGRAPQALRAWTDTAAEVARTRPDRRVEVPAPVGAVASRAEPGRFVGTASLEPAACRAGHAWPAAHDLRQLLALKQSRLI